MISLLLLVILVEAAIACFLIYSENRATAFERVAGALGGILFLALIGALSFTIAKALFWPVASPLVLAGEAVAIMGLALGLWHLARRLDQPPGILTFKLVTWLLLGFVAAILVSIAIGGLVSHISWAQFSFGMLPIFFGCLFLLVLRGSVARFVYLVAHPSDIGDAKLQAAFDREPDRAPTVGRIALRWINMGRTVWRFYFGVLGLTFMTSMSAVVMFSKEVPSVAAPAAIF